MFEREQFIADCRAAVTQDASHKAVSAIVARAVAEPASTLKGLGEPKRGEIQTLYRDRDLTILNVIWAPHMKVVPHNHRMWAVIGVYAGREDNVFWRRLPSGSVEPVAERVIDERETVPLGHNIIHSVVNPLSRLTAAVHVYGGDFFAAERSEWAGEPFTERRYDSERVMRQFREANEASGLA